MTTYNSYQEAKISNPDSVIYKASGNFYTLEGRFTVVTSEPLIMCKPADYCMTYNQCEEFKSGMVVMDLSGIAEINSDAAEFLNSVKRSGKIKPNWDKCFILRAVALENIPTETPEEKEVLDSIESAGEVEWKNGDSVKYHNKHEGEGGLLTFVGIHPTHKDHAVLYGTHLSCGYMSAPLPMLSKPETPQQREDRERLEAAYDLYEESQHAIGCIGYDDFDFFKKSDIQVKFWLAIVDKTNYRKDKPHGTN